MSDLAARMAGPIASAIARRWAEAFLTSMGACADAGRPLTELQQVDVLGVLFQVFDGTQDQVGVFLRCDALMGAHPDVFEGEAGEGGDSA